LDLEYQNIISKNNGKSLNPYRVNTRRERSS
jgi:hypothetical protein